MIEYKNIVFILLIVSLLFSCNSKTDKKEIQECSEYLQKNYISPERYVIEKFKKHDIVILGEFHRIEHDLILIQDLIPLLHKNGIYNVAIEFALYKDQSLIDKLITAKEYDEELAREIHLNFTAIGGVIGYQEYCDIFKSAWKLNSSLDKNVQKMRIIGLNDRLDWHLIKNDADRNDPDVLRKVYKNSSEKPWAERIKKIVDNGEKVLCYCGMHHAFSKYKQPIVDEKGDFKSFGVTRFGNYLYKYFKNEVFTISLNQPWPKIDPKTQKLSMILPVDGVIEQILITLPKNKQRFGFDTANSPLGKLTSKKAYIAVGIKILNYQIFVMDIFVKDG